MIELTDLFRLAGVAGQGVFAVGGRLLISLVYANPVDGKPNPGQAEYWEPHLDLTQFAEVQAGLSDSEWKVYARTLCEALCLPERQPDPNCLTQHILDDRGRRAILEADLPMKCRAILDSVQVR